MTVATIIVVVIVALWMMLRGYRRGAVAIVLGWLPLAVLFATLNVAVYYRWTDAGSLKAKTAAVAAAAALLFVVAWGVYRIFRKRPVRDAENGSGARRWPARINRLAGAMMGLVCCMLLCLPLAALAGALVFRVTMSREQELAAGEQPDPVPKWVDGMRTVSNTLAEIGDAGLLKHVPYARQYSHEVRCVVTILNAPGHQIRGVADKRRLWKIVEVPAVQDALANEEYRKLIMRIQTGDLMAIDSIARSPVTKELLDSPEISELSRSMRPSDLVKDLEQLAATESEMEAIDAGVNPSDQASNSSTTRPATSVNRKSRPLKR